MNRKDITRMCSQAIDETKGVDSPLFRFAALVAAAEREACVANVLAYGGIHIYDASKILETSRARAKE